MQTLRQGAARLKVGSDVSIYSNCARKTSVIAFALGYIDGAMCERRCGCKCRDRIILGTSIPPIGKRACRRAVCYRICSKHGDSNILSRLITYGTKGEIATLGADLLP